MGLIWAVGFNENGGASNIVRDYSDSNKDATTVSNLSTIVDTADDGFMADANGASTDVQVTIGGGISYGEPFTVYWNGVIDAGAGDGYIYFRTNHSYLFWDSVAGTIEGAVWDNAGGAWQTTTHSIVTGTFYKVMLTYSDTNKQRLFLDRSDVIDTNASDASPQDTAPIRLFTDGTDYMDGKTREFWVRDEELDSSTDNNQVQATFFEAQGKPLNVLAHGWTLGQLIRTFTADPIGACVFLVQDADNIRIRIISGQNPGRGEVFKDVGHRFTTTLQHVILNQTSTSPPRIGVYDEISKLSDVGVESKQVVVYDKDGLRQKGNPTRITANITIKSQDRWVMFDVSAGGLTAKLPSNPIDWEIHTFADAEGSCNAGVNLITLDGNGNNINGAATQTLQNSRATKTVVYDTTEWIIIQAQ